VEEDLLNGQGELAKIKEDFTRLKMRTVRQFFTPSGKKGKLSMRSGKETDETYNIPDRVIAHLTRECGGNVHGRHVVEVTSG
jgi:hypothetical protein